MSETVDPNYYKRLASTFTDEKLELIRTINWVLNHSEKGRWDLVEACDKELQKRRGFPTVDIEGQPL
jgi:hypothetical protein